MYGGSFELMHAQTTSLTPLFRSPVKSAGLSLSRPLTSFAARHRRAISHPQIFAIMYSKIVLAALVAGAAASTKNDVYLRYDGCRNLDWDGEPYGYAGMSKSHEFLKRIAWRCCSWSDPRPMPIVDGDCRH